MTTTLIKYNIIHFIIVVYDIGYPDTRIGRVKLFITGLLKGSARYLSVQPHFLLSRLICIEIIYLYYILQFITIL